MRFPLLSLEEAAEALREGKLIIFPTETFFGLGCDALNPDAVGRVFSLKKRALSRPLPVVIARQDDLQRIAEDVSDEARALMKAFWPGPLSVVLPSLPEVPDLLTANAGRIAVRFSPHAAVAALLEATGMVLVASSANLSGGPSVTNPDELEPELISGVAGVFLHGPLPNGGLPSTVVDVVVTREGPLVRILRRGAVSEEALKATNFNVFDAAAEDCAKCSNCP